MDKKKRNELREELRKIPTDKLLRSIENDLRQAMQGPVLSASPRKPKKA